MSGPARPAELNRRTFGDIEFWTTPPPERSPRCDWWRARISAGWRPNKRIRAMGYQEAAKWFGVWIWEYCHVLFPALYGGGDRAVIYADTSGVVFFEGEEEQARGHIDTTFGARQ